MPAYRFPELTVSTPRLLVRPLLVTDVPRVSEIFADRQIQRWLPFPSHDIERAPRLHPAQALRRLHVAETPLRGGSVAPRLDELGYAWCTTLVKEQRESGAGDHYGVVRHEDDEVVGLLWVKRADWTARVTEVAYAIAPEARGLGFATEAVTAISLDLIAEHGFERVELRIAPGNADSRRVAEKAGFTYDGMLRNAGYVNGGRVDLEVWSLIAPDLRARRA